MSVKNFSPNSTIELCYGSLYCVEVGTTNGSGSLTASYTLPDNTPKGTWTLTARDEEGKRASDTITIN